MTMDANSPDIIQPQNPEVASAKPRILIFSQTNGFDASLKGALSEIPFDNDVGWQTDDAISLIKSKRFDLLVTDRTEGLYKIKQLKSHPPIIVVTGDEELMNSLKDEENGKSQRLGVQAVIDMFAEDFPLQFKTVLENVVAKKI